MARVQLHMFHCADMILQGGKEAANEVNATANTSVKQAKATKTNSSLQGILPFLPIIFVLIAILAGYQYLGK